MIYLESGDVRSDFNLALEQYVFDRLPRNESYFMLWQNSPSVIVGKYQNTLEEVNAEYVRAHQIHVTRRLSGGGAVYHDLGNINFTYVMDDRAQGAADWSFFCSPLIETLAHIGIKAELSGRNDVLIDGKKFSGNAQYRREGRVMHHGTILFHSDMSVLGNALRPSKAKIESKGVKSVKSRVTNVWDHLKKPMELEEFWELLRENMAYRQGAVKKELTDAETEAVKQIQRERYSTWEWNWGNSPACTIRKEGRIEGCGNIQVFLSVQNGCIEDCAFYGDFFGEGATEKLKQALSGCPLDGAKLKERLTGMEISRCFYNMTQKDLIGLIMQ